MKRIKLFESFNTNNPLDIKKDIESIFYLLEDYDDLIRFEFRAKGFNLLPCTELESFAESKSLIESFLIGLNFGYQESMRSASTYDTYKNYKEHESEVKEKMEFFLVLLREHLDYIDPKNITIGDGSTGVWIIVKI